MVKRINTIENELMQQNKIIDIIVRRAKILIKNELRRARGEILDKYKIISTIDDLLLFMHKENLHKIFKKQSSITIDTEYERQKRNIKRSIFKSMILLKINKKEVNNVNQGNLELIFIDIERESSSKKEEYITSAILANAASETANTTENKIINSIASATKLLAENAERQGIYYEPEARMNEIINYVNNDLDEIDDSRSLIIAETIIHPALTFANLTMTEISAGALGINLNKEWLTMLDAKVRDAHREAHGQVVKIDEKFFVGGEYLSRPGDPAASLENRINCRCVLGYQII